MVLGNCNTCEKQRDISLSGISKGMCKVCYKKIIWRPKIVECQRCRRMLPMHAKRLCSGCYNSTFHIERTRELNAKRVHNIDVVTYRNLIESCIICGFNNIVEIHHLDHNHSNNSKENLTGLCPNHHKMLHSKKYQKQIFDILRQKGFKVPESNLSDGFFKKRFS